LLISDPIDYKSLNISIIIVNEWMKERDKYWIWTCLFSLTAYALNMNEWIQLVLVTMKERYKLK
jgi:hypothetical protein